MLRLLLLSAAILAGLSGTAFAGHHHHYYGSVYAVGAYPAAYYYPAPVVAYQPAYVVPVSTVTVSSYPLAPVVYSSHVYAPMVPVSAYYVPRPSVVPVYYRHGHPRDIEVDFRVRRNGGYRYKVDFD